MYKHTSFLINHNPKHILIKILIEFHKPEYCCRSAAKAWLSGTQKRNLEQRLRNRWDYIYLLQIDAIWFVNELALLAIPPLHHHLQINQTHAINKYT